MRAVLALSDRLVVLNEGEVHRQRQPARRPCATSRVIEVYLGKSHVA